MSINAAKTGWAGLTDLSVVRYSEQGPDGSPVLDEQTKKRMALAHAYARTFSGHQGLEVLEDLKNFACGELQYDLNHPNCEVIAALRGGFRQMYEYIETQIAMSRQGEFTDGKATKL